MRTLFFHEDDYCQQELVPLAARDYCVAQMKEIETFSDAHPAGEGGASEMYIRKDPPHTLKELSLRVSQIDAAVRDALPRFDQVITEYGSTSRKAPNVTAYGEEDGVALFVETDASNRVSALWIDPWGAGDPNDLAAIFSALPRADALLFVDWAGGVMFAASDRDAWRAYFEALATPE
ncbi:MAG TPA: hypothetical protein VI391_00560 [Thermoanaerobaculia bacterium]